MSYGCRNAHTDSEPWPVTSPRPDPAMMTGKVPSFSPGSTVSSALPGYVALCLALQVQRLVSAHFTVTGPDRPITASVGGEAVLPCHLSPRMSAQSMEVRWFRSQHSAVVHLYQDGQDRYENQMLDYQGRTELLKDDITNGSVSLRIRDIRPSDEGQYACLFQSLTFFQDASVLLQVEGLGSGPDISVEGHQDGGIKVVCQSSGWYPQPEAQWRDLQGQLLPSASENISQAANGLFQTEIAIVITEESNQKVSCCVRNPRVNQERESTIYIADLFFPRVSPWVVALAVILALVIALAIYCIWTQRRAKETLQTHMKNQKGILLTEMEREKERLQSELAKQKEAHLAEKAKLLAEIRWRSAQLYAVDVTLDPNTANPYLILAEDWKSVTHRDKRQDLPDNPERFDTMAVVLGAEGFTGRKRYWEVEVGEKNLWTLGVCREDVSRKGHIVFLPRHGYWTIWQHAGQFMANTSPTTLLPVSVRPRRLGIFLDYEAGEVSFYNVTDKSHLFTFTDTFSGVLCPYFNPEYNKGGTNMFPLIICPVPAQAGGSLCPGQ
ncbi:butyrophilin subfamily 2 member A1-like isoform X7 [Mauremys mutica]|uniref:butyrophilin subfamily 2 member A1-like isoform X6 n=1 Tax=Mauremys mutica TaxID=74926 RepID=UPI001D14B994|nr:butyrophilin subfamily 2 member A1-like isoform X6 [Mauremys mutica]XP_044856927.1 butyrophilin subfamily 2 member A1-like isoform X7 [Mauremys mutica]